jgi:hypothetical protein
MVILDLVPVKAERHRAVSLHLQGIGSRKIPTGSHLLKSRSSSGFCNLYLIGRSNRQNAKLNCAFLLTHYSAKNLYKSGLEYLW